MRSWRRGPWGRQDWGEEWREVRGPLLGLLLLAWGAVGGVIV